MFAPQMCHMIDKELSVRRLEKWESNYGLDKVELSIYYDIKEELMWMGHEAERAMRYFKEKKMSRSASQIASDEWHRNSPKDQRKLSKFKGYYFINYYFC